jgi:hypothetical protein
VAGLGLALRHPLQPLHGVALLWFLLFILPSALSSPGHPVRELGATPAVFLFPLLAMRALVARAYCWDMSRPLAVVGTGTGTGDVDDQRVGAGSKVEAPPAAAEADAVSTATAGGVVTRHPRPREGLGRFGAGRAAVALVALSVVGSSLWSLHDYFQVWAPSDAAYVAFQGDVRDSLAAIDQLPDDGAPVYYSTWTLERLLSYLSPERTTRAFDGRISGTLPASGSGYLIYPTVTAPSPALLRYLTGGAPWATGRSPDGALAWQAWLLGEPQRARLPYTIPTLSFPDGIDLLGFEIVPAPPLGASGAPLPNSQRMVAMTLIWRVPAGAAPRDARLRLAPVASLTTGEPVTADFALLPSPPELLGDGAHEIIITRTLLPFPVGAGVADAQLALGSAPGNAGEPVSFSAFVDLNRVAYRLETAP